jgi:hypothetical protein
LFCCLFLFVWLRFAEIESHTILSIKLIMDLLRFAEIESHTILSIKLIMDLLRFAEIEPHAIISIKLIMDLLRFASSISLCIIDPLHKNFLQSHEIYTC